MTKLTKEEEDGIRHCVKYIKMIPKLVEGMDMHTKIFLDKRNKLIEQNEDCIAWLECEGLKEGFFSDFYKRKRWNEVDDTHYDDYIVPVHAFFRMMCKQGKGSWIDILMYGRWMRSGIIGLIAIKQIQENAEKRANGKRVRNVDLDSKEYIVKVNRKYGFTEEDYDNMISFTYFLMSILYCPKL